VTHGNLRDLTGKRFGRLLTLGLAPHPVGTHVKYFVRCDCGKEKTVSADKLSSGNTVSCGCKRASQNLTHGATTNGKVTSEYQSWFAMIQRCRNKNNQRAHRYIKRGIKVCDYFKKFSNFISDIGIKPSAGHSIDRKDNNGHYSCGHCAECVREGWVSNLRWATDAEQRRNRSDTHLVMHNGKTMCLRTGQKK
jgi:hypothetical protein